MRINEIIEAFDAGQMPNIASDKYQSVYGALIAQSTKLADIRANLSLYCYSNRVYMLVKNGTTVVGNVSLSKEKVAGKGYYHIDGIFVDAPYRKTSALHWLLYSVKEVLDMPVIADGAIFTDGTELIKAAQKHRMFNVWKLNKATGERSELSTTINDTDYCYLFDSTQLGFGKQIFVEGMPFTWYPLFEDV